MGKMYLFLLFLISILCLVIPAKSFADTSCQPIYGGGQTCTVSSDVSIDKKILNPSTNIMVDNLGINDPKHRPGFITNFQITITNTSSRTISNVAVRDIFPQYVKFGAGPGSFDSNTGVLSFNLGSLGANESRTYAVIGRVVDSANLPQGTICLVNQATATADNSQMSQDNSQFCIENVTPVVVTTVKGGFPIFPPTPIISTPKTGSEALTLLALVPSGIAGLFLIRYANKKEDNN
jgi:uncharacterized repeat protein (TIGR01451 family)